MNITLDLSHIPLFFIVFYIILPIVVFFFAGSFWAKIYAVISSVLGAVLAAAMPMAFIDLILPDVIPEGIVEQFAGLAEAALKYGSMVFAGIVFFALLLLQHGVVKLVEATGWIGSKE
ncbi:MAG: hypothetical protein QXJ17_04445 [Nitrososphaeria archaeon]